MAEDPDSTVYYSAKKNAAMSAKSQVLTAFSPLTTQDPMLPQEHCHAAAFMRYLPCHDLVLWSTVYLRLLPLSCSVWDDFGRAQQPHSPMPLKS